MTDYNKSEVLDGLGLKPKPQNLIMVLGVGGAGGNAVNHMYDMGIADVFVVNKSDRDGAEKVAADVKVMLDLLPERDWRPPVSLASAEHNRGIDDIIANIDSHRNYLNQTEDGKRRKIAKIRTEVENILKREILERVTREWERKLSGDVLKQIEERHTDPYTVAAECLDEVISKRDRG